MARVFAVICLMIQVLQAREISHLHTEGELPAQLRDSRDHMNNFFKLTQQISKEGRKTEVISDSVDQEIDSKRPQVKSIFPIQDDEAVIETVNSDEFDINNDEFDVHDEFGARADDVPVVPDHVPGLVLPISHRKETLQDIYVREKLPEIQRIIASGDQAAIARIIAESEDDPFTVLPNNLKYSQLLAADLFFSFLTKMVTWFVLISLLLPALVPIFTILSLGAELAALWLIPDLSEP